MSIIIGGLRKEYGELRVLDNLYLRFEQKMVTVILGPSGCGKTTLLNILSGMDGDFSGQVSGINRSRISYLFQEPRLLPWKTVWGNLEFVLRDHVDPSKIEGLIEKNLELVELMPFKDYFPNRLSGGMRQRVSLARAFAYPAEIILMDEPFQALDLGIKLALVKAFNAVWKAAERTVVFVTHDIHEALLLGDHIILLSQRPSRVIEEFRIGTERGERSLDSEEIMQVEKELYSFLTASG